MSTPAKIYKEKLETALNRYTKEQLNGILRNIDYNGYKMTKKERDSYKKSEFIKCVMIEYEDPENDFQPCIWDGIIDNDTWVYDYK